MSTTTSLNMCFIGEIVISLEHLFQRTFGFTMDDFIHWDDSDLDLDILLGEYTDYDQDCDLHESEENDSDIDVPMAPVKFSKMSQSKKKAGKEITTTVYECPECKRTYKTIVGFRGHMKKKHNRTDIKAYEHRQTATPVKPPSSNADEKPRMKILPLTTEAEMMGALRNGVPKALKLIICDPMMDASQSGSTVGQDLIQIAKSLCEDVDTINDIIVIVTPKLHQVFKGFGDGSTLSSDREVLWSRFHQVCLQEEFISSMHTCIENVSSHQIRVVHIFTQCLLDRLIQTLFQFLSDSMQRADEMQADHISGNDQAVLFYIAGYIVHALIKKKTISGQDICALINSLHTRTESKECYIRTFSRWTEKINRGGLTLPSDNCFLLVRSMEITVRGQVDLSNLCANSLKCDRLKELILTNPMVLFYWDKLIVSEEELKLKLLEFLVTLFLNVRGGAVAKFVKRQQQKEKRSDRKANKGKNSQSLRKVLKSRDNFL